MDRANQLSSPNHLWNAKCVNTKDYTDNQQIETTVNRYFNF